MAWCASTCEIFRILVEHWELGKVPACLLQTVGGPVPLISWQRIGLFVLGGKISKFRWVIFFNLKKKALFQVVIVSFYKKSFDLQSSHCYFFYLAI
jgi:hypothetical protein